jgi:CTD small phosphatase-like protein 2
VIDRDPSQLVLIDNAAYSYAFQLDNAIPILPYYKGRNDYELRALQSYIDGLLLTRDMREVNRKTFKLHRYCEFDNIDHLVRELYSETA